MTTTTLPKTNDSNTCCNGAEASCEQSSVAKTYSVKPVYRVSDSKESYQVTVDLPGVNRSAVDLLLEDGVLSISAERTWKKPEGWKVHSRSAEFNYALKLSLGDEVDETKISAQVDNGVLVLNLAKKAEKQPRKIDIS